jgi:hypothetical protein
MRIHPLEPIVNDYLKDYSVIDESVLSSLLNITGEYLASYQKVSRSVLLYMYSAKRLQRNHSGWYLKPGNVDNIK